MNETKVLINFEMKPIVLYCAVCALLLGTVTAKALKEKDGQVEQSTESPNSDMALVGKYHIKNGKLGHHYYINCPFF